MRSWFRCPGSSTRMPSLELSSTDVCADIPPLPRQLHSRCSCVFPRRRVVGTPQQRPPAPRSALCCSALPSTGQWGSPPGVAGVAQNANGAAQSCPIQGLSRWVWVQLTLSFRACGWIFQYILFGVLSHSQALFFCWFFFFNFSLYNTTKKKLWDGIQFVYGCYLSHARIREWLFSTACQWNIFFSLSGLRQITFYTNVEIFPRAQMITLLAMQNF